MKMWPKDRITDRTGPEVSESGLEHQEEKLSSETGGMYDALGAKSFGRL